jgi:TonB family protein
MTDSRIRGAARFLAVLAAAIALNAGAAEQYGPLDTRLAPKVIDAKSRPPSAAPAGDAQASAGERPAGTPDPTYYKRSLLDEKPYIVTHVEPAYPSGAPPTGGKARIRLFINERGLVDDIKVEQSTPIARFGQVAAEAFKSAQFAPGKRAGNAVKSQILIELEFHPLMPQQKR